MCTSVARVLLFWWLSLSDDIYGGGEGAALEYSIYLIRAVFEMRTNCRCGCQKAVGNPEPGFGNLACRWRDEITA